jgi:hypothetical protein
MTEEEYELENNAHKLIVKLCAAKNIKLDLRQEGKTGHCEIPEIWVFEKPVPLDQTDMEEISANSALRAKWETDNMGNVFVTEFSRGAGWVVYELES